MLAKLLITLLTISALAGCSDKATNPAGQTQAPWVMTFAIEPGNDDAISLSGTVRAQVETPLAFQVNGRILNRYVNAGQQVEADQLLFTLDPRDLDEAQRAAQAQLAVAQAALRNTTSELGRQRQLLANNYVSKQALERFELDQAQARSRVLAAEAELERTKNARSYAEVRASSPGIIVEVFSESGQVVGAGQTIARLAHDGGREIEVFLAQGNDPPSSGQIVSSDGRKTPVKLREIAGAADAVSRTWRARYQVQPGDSTLPLGSVVRVELIPNTVDDQDWQIPLGALDERGHGPQVWQIKDGRVEPVAVQLISLSKEMARIRADLPVGTRIVALGTHLLKPGMSVRERKP